MSTTVYEFPLKEKVRNYLRIEHSIAQLKTGASLQDPSLQIHFFEQLFTLIDLLERLDLRSDLQKDLDSHEKNLVYWSQHPSIDSSALEQTLRTIINLREGIKKGKKFGSELKEDKFLSGIRQRFAIPGGVCSFDLPNLHYWLHLPSSERQMQFEKWLITLAQLEEAVAITLSFLREKGTYQEFQAPNGFYQGAADDKNELVRIRCANDKGYYPMVSGNKYRYALRFQWFESLSTQSAQVEETVTFSMASC